LLLTNAAVLRFPMLWVGGVGGDGDEGEGAGYSQTVVGDCGVTSFFVEVNVLVLHPGRSFERCRPGVLVLGCVYKYTRTCLGVDWSSIHPWAPGTARRANPSDSMG